MLQEVNKQFTQIGTLQNSCRNYREIFAVSKKNIYITNNGRIKSLDTFNMTTGGPSPYREDYHQQINELFLIVQVSLLHPFLFPIK